MLLDFFVSDLCEKSFQRGDFLASVHCRWYGDWVWEKVPRRRIRSALVLSI